MLKPNDEPIPEGTVVEPFPPTADDFMPVDTQTWEHLFANLVRTKPAFFGSVFLVALFFVAIFAPLVSPHNPSKVQVSERLKPPAWLPKGRAANFLGTDALGRDIFSRLLYGSRISILVGLSSVVLSGIIGIVLGLVSGYFGGAIDTIVMRSIDFIISMPTIPLWMALAAALHIEHQIF